MHSANDHRSAMETHKPVTAVFTALAMMVACAVPVLLPVPKAQAAVGGIDDAIILDGDNCDRENVTLGSDTATQTEDTGVATYVGGNMYIGAPGPNNTVNGSYAAEAEGLTYVQGNLLMNPLKNSWNQALPSNSRDWFPAGFRWGTVGFGAQFRPAVGSVALAVAGNTVQAYSHGSFVGATGYWNDKKTELLFTNDGYTAKLAAPKTNVANPLLGSQDRPSVLETPAKTWDDTPGVTWNAPTSDLAKVNNIDIAEFSQKFVSRSDKFSNLPATGTVDATNTTVNGVDINADNTRYMRQKYVGDGDQKLSYEFKYGNGENKEKLLTFTGDNKDLEVFSIDASAFGGAGNNGEYSGISYSFVNIKEHATVVINVRGEVPAFHNGWRFWWNGEEIANGYTSEKYSRAASSIMWNFHDTENLTVYGGAYNKSDNTRTTNDDPAAAMLGSIMVPKGRFDDHVTTNGRVWVGRDLYMNNPSVVTKDPNHEGLYWDGDSASVIDMDQERHNLPFNFPCSTIGWKKVGQDEQTPLAGTTWAVYGTKADAMAGTNPLRQITDASDNGEFQVTGLDYAANYFIREIATVDGYKVNTNIYQIQTKWADSLNGTEIQPNTQIAAVYDYAGTVTGITEMNASDAIINRRKTEVTWEKYSEKDSDFTRPLAGSVWKITGGSAGTMCANGCRVEDNVAVAPTGITVKTGNSSITENGQIDMDLNSTLPLLAEVTADGQDERPTQLIDWVSSKPEFLHIENPGQSGLQVSLSADQYTDEIIVITAKARRFPSVQFTFKVRINKPVNLTTVLLSKNAQWNGGGAIDGSTVVMHYKTTNNAADQAIEMTKSGDYHKAAIDTGSDNLTGIYFSNDKQNPSKWLNKNNNSSEYFDVIAGWTLTIQSATQSSQTQSKSSGSARNRVRSATADSRNELPVLADEDDAVGKFKVTGLEIGITYMLEEIQAPVGFYKAKSVQFTIGEDGKATWGDHKKITDPQTVVRWSKVDADNNSAPLNGAGWTVYQQGANDSWVEMTIIDCFADDMSCPVNQPYWSKKDTENEAAFEIKQLPIGEYRAIESTVPAGYDPNKAKELYFTITDDAPKGGVVVGTSDGNLTSNQVGNARRRGAVTWIKTAEGDKEGVAPLAGSEWKLTYKSHDKAATYTDSKEIIVCAITDTSTSCTKNGGTIPMNPAPAWAANMESTAGKFKFEELPWGDYDLEETKAPDGYNLDATVHSFKIGPQGDGFNFSVSYVIENEPGVVLPNTGGSGHGNLLVIGAGCLLVSMAGCALALRREI